MHSKLRKLPSRVLTPLTDRAIIIHRRLLKRWFFPKDNSYDITVESATMQNNREFELTTSFTLSLACCHPFICIPVLAPTPSLVIRLSTPVTVTFHMVPMTAVPSARLRRTIIIRARLGIR
jgi:hypothetical protein